VFGRRRASPGAAAPSPTRSTAARSTARPEWTCRRPPPRARPAKRRRGSAPHCPQPLRREAGIRVERRRGVGRNQSSPGRRPYRARVGISEGIIAARRRASAATSSVTRVSRAVAVGITESTDLRDQVSPVSARTPWSGPPIVSISRVPSNEASRTRSLAPACDRQLAPLSEVQFPAQPVAARSIAVYATVPRTSACAAPLHLFAACSGLFGITQSDAVQFRSDAVQFGCLAALIRARRIHAIAAAFATAGEYVRGTSGSGALSITPAG
jgi:hypothetical protein